MQNISAQTFNELPLYIQRFYSPKVYQLNEFDIQKDFILGEEFDGLPDDYQKHFLLINQNGEERLYENFYGRNKDE